MRIVPGSRSTVAAAAWLILGVAASVWPALGPVWVGTGVALGVVMLLDAALLLSFPKPAAERPLPESMALGVAREVELVLRNPSAREAVVTVRDDCPLSMECADLPWTGKIPARGFCRVALRFKPVERGRAEFGRIYIQRESPLRFWSRRHVCGEPGTVKVYPNYEPVLRLALLATAHREEQMGIRHVNRPGQSREFRQLRDYQEGDPLSRIDWKATSRRVSLVSRDYEEQRNQTIILMVDCGRRMRALDGELTQFDHCLNALLLLSYIALRQGDQVGVMGFGGTRRWLPPVRGAGAMPVILNHLYDYQPTSAPGDFSEAAELLLTRQKRRAMAVFCTNLRTEDRSHLEPPLRLVSRRHLAVVASLSERDVTDSLQAPVETLEDACRHAAARGYLEERRAVAEALKSRGVLTLDAPADSLPVALGNLYLDIKARGIL